MKQLLKRIARKLWNLTGPVRRPIMRKVHQGLTQVLQVAVTDPIQARLNGLETGLNLARHEVHAQGEETNLNLDSLVREVARLQWQVEALQIALAERDAEGSGLSVVEAGSTDRDYPAEAV